MSLSRRISSLFFLSVFFFSNIAPIFLMPSHEIFAAYTESSNNTFLYYKQQIISAGEAIESEYRINSTVSTSSLQNAKNLIKLAYDRLPDRDDFGIRNNSAYNGVNLALDLAIKNPTSQTYVQSAVGALSQFVSAVSIEEITGSITANPSIGNAPLTVSFLATNIIDPSGVTVPAYNYIWWVREDGGYRRELGRGPSLTREFTSEGTYQVFLDVVSGSKNTKWYTDVLPLSISQSVQVKPKLWEVVLMINGVNISTLSQFKISPTIGRIGVIFDATASRAISNGTIKKTKWDFGNGNTYEYNGSPRIERQIFANEWVYPVKIQIETNEGTVFQKEIQLIVVDPAAVISTEKTLWYIGEDFQMKSVSYFWSTANTQYNWTVQSATNTETKPIYTQAGQAFSYKFPKVGEYIVTLITRSPNGSEDRDSKMITIESHEPTVNLAEPAPISPEKPNTILFDASRSFDPDTASAKDLTYRWMIDGESVALDNIWKEGAMGTYTFSEKWVHTVSLSVTNKYGKITTVDKQFTVASTLSVNLNIVPRAAPIGTLVTFQAISPKAIFYEWNPGDGSPATNWQMNSIEHVYKKTGIYTASLTVKNRDESEVNRIERKVYVTDTNSPFALIDVGNSSSTVIEDPTACSQDGAYLVNRAEWTTLDGSNSVNIDGNTAGLTYTWKYLDRVKTGPTLSEKFSELWCFPVELTVKSDRNGASHTSKKYIQIKNIVPKLTSVSTKIDPNKKDSQKVLVNVSAEGARDEDGVITSYIWFYKTESDSEPQNIRITQSPSTTFVLPNITEKYTFWVILEDNDGARTNSTEYIKDQTPLLITNENANQNMPLITLSVPQTQVLAGESVSFGVSAKTIVGTDITGKSEYQWDFNGDGKIDKKTTESRTSYTYPSSGNYTAKVKVTYNGTSNSKYQNIVVKNELKANVRWYKTDESVHLMNTSNGSYDSVLWQIGDIQSESLYDVSVPRDVFDGTGTSSKILTVRAGADESSSVEITSDSLMDVSSTLSGWVYIQSYPELVDETITLSSRWEKALIALYGNIGTQFLIDTNTKIDSDTNGTPDDDADNREYTSYVDGSVFAIDGNELKSRTQTIRISILKNGSIIGTRDIQLVAGYIADTDEGAVDINSGSGTEGFSERDKANLEQLQAKIRSLESDDRIILTQDYNSLIENWDDGIERTKKLIDIQEEVINSSGISESDKAELSKLIDTILVGDANATDEITVATHLIESLIPSDNPNRSAIIEKLEAIKSNPTNLSENKVLGTDILTLIKDDTSIEDKYKLIIKSQLQIITSGGQESVPADDIPSAEDEGSGIMGFIKWTVLVFSFVLGIIIVIVFIGFLIYRASRKHDDMGFQDFLIDSIFHAKSHTPSQNTSPNIVSNTDNIIIKENTSPIVDPLTTFSPVTPEVKSQPIDPMSVITHAPEKQDPPTENTLPEVQGGEATSIPDWLKPQSHETQNEETQNEEIAPIESSEPPTPTDVQTDTTPENIDNSNLISSSESSDATPETSDIPDWLKGTQETEDTVIEASDETPSIVTSKEDDRATLEDIPSSPVTPETVSEVSTSPPEISPSPDSTNSDALPDWLVDSVSQASHTSEVSAPPPKKKSAPNKPKKAKEEKNTPDESQESVPAQKSTETTSDLPDWLK